jgi:hypothetical protein
MALLALGVIRTAGRKGDINSYATRMAALVAHRAIFLLPNRVPSVVATDSIRCGFFPLSLAITPEKAKFKIAQYHCRFC